ncbi:helix-turn-helix transcriptional regulator [Rhizobium gallicum]|nr:WYL domain-containing protein [Rhizobium gallicum]
MLLWNRLSRIYAIICHIRSMNRACTSDRLERLDLLASRLKADEAMTLANLAVEFRVSVRTLARDLSILRERGLPVETERGRGGGVRLDRHWGVGRLSLTYREAVDLLASLAIAEQLQSPWLIANLDSIRRKLSASFSPSLKDRISGLRKRILVGRPASAMVLQGFAAPALDRGDLLTAFLELRVLRIVYEDATRRLSDRIIEPQLLLLNYPVWYVIAWDLSRQAVRSFRCDRIAAADLREETFRLRPAGDFAEAIDGIEAISP